MSATPDNRDVNSSSSATTEITPLEPMDTSLPSVLEITQSHPAPLGRRGAKREVRRVKRLAKKEVGKKEDDHQSPKMSSGQADRKREKQRLRRQRRRGTAPAQQQEYSL
ncbi:hypothetical protein FOCC_FOCC016594 [Frankliniella occidentalis]|nr:hypothetical protein FOCC_FOCC016594 [Frankliniella occidentalis]